jgi:hypothetical protein
VRFVASRWRLRGAIGKVQPYRITSHLKEQIMKVRKNLEAVFLAIAVVAVPASYAAEKVQVLHAVKSAQAVQVADDAAMQVVVVKGHRLTAAEKAALN